VFYDKSMPACGHKKTFAYDKVCETRSTHKLTAVIGKALLVNNVCEMYKKRQSNLHDARRVPV